MSTPEETKELIDAELIDAVLKLWRAGGIISSELALDLCRAVMKRHETPA